MAVPWQRYGLTAGILLILVLFFQFMTRGELTPVIAVVVAVGYVAVAELVRRRTDS